MGVSYWTLSLKLETIQLDIILVDKNQTVTTNSIHFWFVCDILSFRSIWRLQLELLKEGLDEGLCYWFRGHYLSTMTFTTTTFQSSQKAGGEPARRNMPSCSTFDLSMYQQNLNYISPHWKLWKRKPEGNHRRNNKLTGMEREGASGFSSGLSFCEIYGRPCFLST